MIIQISIGIFFHAWHEWVPQNSSFLRIVCSWWLGGFEAFSSFLRELGARADIDFQCCIGWNIKGFFLGSHPGCSCAFDRLFSLKILLWFGGSFQLARQGRGFLIFGIVLSLDRQGFPSQNNRIPPNIFWPFLSSRFVYSSCRWFHMPVANHYRSYCSFYLLHFLS